MPTTSNSSQFSGDQQRQLLRCLDRQAAIGRELRELGRAQRQCLTGEASETLLEVINDRQSLVDELTDLHRQCRAFFDNWPASLESLAAADRDRALQLRQSLADSIAQVLADDETDRATMESKRKAIDGQLRNLAKGRTTNRAYVDSHEQASSNPVNRYTDRQG